MKPVYRDGSNGARERSGGGCLRRPVKALALMIAGALVAGIGLYVARFRHQPDLEAWHRAVPNGELGGSAAPRVADLDGYLALEEKLFAQLAAQADLGGSASEISRYRRDSPTNPRRFPVDWNRTRWIPPAPVAGGERGAALLLHGLTDSPYSLRAVGEGLARQGLAVLCLRLPGHGTVPGALTGAGVDEWRTAVRLAAAAVARRAAGKPWAIVGYSNGAALALDHAVAALEDEAVPRPGRLVLISPAFAVSKAAGLARFQAALSVLPGLEKLAWSDVVPEYDPYKYNSFPLHAAHQIHRLTSDLEEGLANLEETGRLGELPPILTLQSVVDSTVPPVASLERLYGRLPRNGSELVIFDVNRRSRSLGFLADSVDDLLVAARGRSFPFELTLVTDTPAGMVARTRPAGAPDSAARTETPLALQWPRGIYSLSHVAVPIPADDPIYGAGPTHGPFPFGTLEPRGERGVLVLPLDLLMRLRYNPFFPYLEQRVQRFLGLPAGAPVPAEPGATDPDVANPDAANPDVADRNVPGAHAPG
jgi:alpha-beta hydrolase superfamily lysophospholipase